MNVRLSVRLSVPSIWPPHAAAAGLQEISSIDCWAAGLTAANASSVTLHADVRSWAQTSCNFLHRFDSECTNRVCFGACLYVARPIPAWTCTDNVHITMQKMLHMQRGRSVSVCLSQPLAVRPCVRWLWRLVAESGWGQYYIYVATVALAVVLAWLVITQTRQQKHTDKRASIHSPTFLLTFFAACFRFHRSAVRMYIL